MSAHFGMLRSFNRRDTYSLRSACPGYIWAVNACTASPTACRRLSPIPRPSAILCGLRRLAHGPNGVPDRTAGARALPGGYNRLAGPPEWHVSTERAWVIRSFRCGSICVPQWSGTGRDACDDEL